MKIDVLIVKLTPCLVDHYVKMLGARSVSTRFHPYRLEVPEGNAQNVVDKYTLEGDLNVK